MAHLKHCPHCNKETDNQKKGMINGNQRYLCSKCNKRWTENVVTAEQIRTSGPINPKKSDRRVTAVEPAPIKKGTTTIKINNNILKENLRGKLTLEEALDIASDNFKEIQRDKVIITEQGDTITYAFQITTGTKG